MKTYIITGGNSGLGFETAKRIAETDAQIILACRNLEKGQAAAERIKQESSNPNIEVRQLDWASLTSVRAFADSVKGLSIDVLNNNAGLSGQHTGTTEDGFDVVFQSNYLGHFLLTLLLLPQMAEQGRILNISSDMHNPPFVNLEWRDLDSIIHPTEETVGLRYYFSKLFNLYFTYELDRQLRLQEKTISVNAFNPGFMADTNLAGGQMTPERAAHIKETMPDRYSELPLSADAIAELLTQEQFREISGKYFDRSTHIAQSSELSYNEKYAKELWETSLKLVGEG